MITGAKNWQDRARYYAQTNNSVEALLQKTGRRWLESCGPTSAVMCLDALGVPVVVRTPGGWSPQAEDVLTLLLNDPRHEADRRVIRAGVEGIPGNRVPQYYPWAVKLVFGAEARMAMPLTWLQLTEALVAQRAVQICRIEPGHYQAAVAYDDATREVIYHDPWPEGQPDGKGFAKRLSEQDWLGLYHGWGIIYG